MKKSEVLKILTIASAFDSRRPTDEQIEAWFSVIGDLPFREAEIAVREHFRTSREYFMPVHVIEGVQAVLAEQAWEPPALTPEEQQLCAAAGVPAEEFVERRDDSEWITHLRSKWMGIES
ncbi:hypothetical protein [Leucobacter sp.]